MHTLGHRGRNFARCGVCCARGPMGFFVICCPMSLHVSPDWLYGTQLRPRACLCVASQPMLHNASLAMQFCQTLKKTRHCECVATEKRCIVTCRNAYGVKHGVRCKRACNTCEYACCKSTCNGMCTSSLNAPAMQSATHIENALFSGEAKSVADKTATGRQCNMRTRPAL